MLKQFVFIFRHESHVFFNCKLKVSAFVSCTLLDFLYSNSLAMLGIEATSILVGCFPAAGSVDWRLMFSNVFILAGLLTYVNQCIHFANTTNTCTTTYSFCQDYPPMCINVFTLSGPPTYVKQCVHSCQDYQPICNMFTFLGLPTYVQQRFYFARTAYLCTQGVHFARTTNLCTTLLGRKTKSDLRAICGHYKVGSAA